MVAVASGIDVFMLQEFRLSKADTDGAVARIVDSSHVGAEPSVPLLTSVADRRNVAIIRALRFDESKGPDAAQQAALDPFVSMWSLPKEYSVRISERSVDAPSHYRLAVTESGINHAETDPPESVAEGGTSSHLGLLWIGKPVGTHAGLLVLLGNDDPAVGGRSRHAWPLPLSSYLGVRIYEDR